MQYLLEFLKGNGFSGLRWNGNDADFDELELLGKVGVRDETYVLFEFYKDSETRRAMYELIDLFYWYPPFELRFI